MPTWLTFVLVIIIALALLWFLLPSPVARWLLAAERTSSGLRSRRISADEIDWHYLDGGKGEPLLLLHGFNADAHHFTRLARHLRSRFRLIAPDLPGFGDTGCIEGLDFGIEAQAGRVLAFLDALGIERCHVGGNSMGGYLAAAIARIAPQRVQSLWLLAPGGLQDAPYAELFQEVAAGRHNPLVVRNLADFERLAGLCFVRRPWMPLPLRRHLARRAAAGCDRSLDIFEALRFGSPPLESFAAEIKVPTLLMWGDHDRVLHPDGHRILSELLPDSRGILLKDTGHLPMIERPADCARAWLEFNSGP
jgi:abhydrolase domain-containing protein 6